MAKRVSIDNGLSYTDADGVPPCCAVRPGARLMGPRKRVTVRSEGQDVTTTASSAAAALGRLGGLAGRGASKARKVSSDQARAAINARWDRYRAEKAARGG